MRTVFRNVNLIDGDSAARPRHSVVVEGNSVTEVVPDAALHLRPTDSVYELSGKSLMPGMTQGHWHGSYENITFTPKPGGLEKHPSYMAYLALKNAQLALSHGFTSLIGAATGECLDAQLNAAIQNGVVSGPRITPCGHWLITTGDVNDYDEHWWWGISAQGVQKICDGADEFAKAVRQEIKEGAKIIKIISDQGHLLRESGARFVTMTEAELVAVITTAHARGAKVRSHIDSKQGILDGIRLGLDIFDHADELDEECLEKMVAAKSYMCPSLVLPKAILDHFKDATNQRAFNDDVRRSFDSMVRMLPLAARAGLRVILGDDWGTWLTPHGNYAKEFELYADIGIPNLDIIRWATKHPAECVGMEDRLGTIAAGKYADLLVIDGDPSSDIRVLCDVKNIKLIMKDGRLHKDELAPRRANVGEQRLAATA
jgi:imidazolonepropionase-like amidohydrolase